MLYFFGPHTFPSLVVNPAGNLETREEEGKITMKIALTPRELLAKVPPKMLVGRQDCLA